MVVVVMVEVVVIVNMHFQIEEWAPRFDFWGFRWCQVQISGPSPSDVQVVSIEGEFIYADLKSVGTFECSNALWNRCVTMMRLVMCDV